MPMNQLSSTNEVLDKAGKWLSIKNRVAHFKKLNIKTFYNKSDSTRN